VKSRLLKTPCQHSSGDASLTQLSGAFLERRLHNEKQHYEYHETAPLSHHSISLIWERWSMYIIADVSSAELVRATEQLHIMTKRFAFALIHKTLVFRWLVGLNETCDLRQENMSLRNQPLGLKMVKLSLCLTSPWRSMGKWMYRSTFSWSRH
jgi:hypothetical protein